MKIHKINVDSENERVESRTFLILKKSWDKMSLEKKSSLPVITQMLNSISIPEISDPIESKGSQFLKMYSRTFKNKEGEEKEWNFVKRDKEVVTVIPRSSRYNRFLLIAQPRIPIGKIELAFPAGLVDVNESVLDASKRELREETGYEVKDVQNISVLTVKSAGLSDEVTCVTTAFVDEKSFSLQNLENDEDIFPFWISPTDFWKLYKDLDQSRCIVDSLLFQYMLGQIRFKPIVNSKWLSVNQYVKEGKYGKEEVVVNRWFYIERGDDPVYIIAIAKNIHTNECRVLCLDDNDNSTFFFNSLGFSELNGEYEHQNEDRFKLHYESYAKEELSWDEYMAFQKDIPSKISEWFVELDRPLRPV